MEAEPERVIIGMILSGIYSIVSISPVLSVPAGVFCIMERTWDPETRGMCGIMSQFPDASTMPDPMSIPDPLRIRICSPQR